MTPATSASVSRFHRRQWRGRLRSARPYLLAILLAGLVGFAAWVLLFSSWLALEEVEVRGQEQISGSDVRAAAGLDVGTPLLRVDLDDVSERVRALPAVADVSVHRSWPHTLSITVTERQPVANIVRAGDWWVMDREGVVFRKTGRPLRALPIVAVESGADAEALREVASVVTVLPDEVLTATRRVKARSMDSITLMLRDGREVVWGSSAQSDRKVAVLAVLLEHKARVYDVSVPEQPTAAD